MVVVTKFAMTLREVIYFKSTESQAIKSQTNSGNANWNWFEKDRFENPGLEYNSGAKFWPVQIHFIQNDQK